MSDQGISQVYENLAIWYDKNRDKALLEKPYLTALLENLTPNPSILDLGCGSGQPIAEFLLQQGCTVTGVDGSASMIAMCRKRFGQMEWIQSDMRGLNLHRKFDAIIAWDSFFHLSCNDQRSMFSVFTAHLVSGGLLLFTSGFKQGEVYGQMGGHEVYHASLDSSEYYSLLERNGFEIISHCIQDATCGDHTVWLARFKPL